MYTASALKSFFKSNISCSPRTTHQPKRAGPAGALQAPGGDVVEMWLESPACVRPALPSVHRGHLRLGFADLDAWMLSKCSYNPPPSIGWLHSSHWRVCSKAWPCVPSTARGTPATDRGQGSWKRLCPRCLKLTVLSEKVLSTIKLKHSWAGLCSTACQPPLSVRRALPSVVSLTFLFKSPETLQPRSLSVCTDPWVFQGDETTS